MRLTDSPEETTWRAEVRSFIQAELPPSLKQVGNSRIAPDTELQEGNLGPTAGGSGFKMPTGAMEEWRQKLASRGWIAPAWPKEYGGAGLSTMEQFIMNQEFAEAGAPTFGGMGVSMAGPTIIVHGTEEQKAEHLPKILQGETHWCQGFSEPGSGSDLASLQTRAVRDGDEYIINGSKIWTSGAHKANWMFMLARTDPDAPKHRGISFFLIDFKSPGITVQPLVTMAGTHHFNQIFFDNVRVPAKNIIGETNRGWYVGTTTLDFERSGIGAAVGIQQVVADLIKFSKEHAEDGTSQLARNPRLRAELIDRYIDVSVSKMLAYRVVHMQNIGRIPNHEASMAKLFSSELRQRVYGTAERMIGLYGLAMGRKSPYAVKGSEYVRSYLDATSATIAGGTSEIQRNIIAQRGMGMPRD